MGFGSCPEMAAKRVQILLEGKSAGSIIFTPVLK